MTREEAIQEIINLANNLQIIPSTSTGQAVLMAIKSLEAWEKIRKEIASDGQSDINAKYVLNLIDKHLSEVSE